MASCASPMVCWRLASDLSSFSAIMTDCFSRHSLRKQNAEKRHVNTVALVTMDKKRRGGPLSFPITIKTKDGNMYEQPLPNRPINVLDDLRNLGGLELGSTVQRRAGAPESVASSSCLDGDARSEGL